MVKIRAKKDCLIGGYSQGDVFDASDMSGALGDVYRFIDSKGFMRISPRCMFDVVEEQSPVRTVTRKEIVAGKYGIVTIKECGFIHINAMGTPDNLREAAHTLNQIAEVLEDGAE